MEFEIDDYFGTLRLSVATDADLNQLSRSITLPVDSERVYALSHWQFVKIEPRDAGFASGIVLVGIRLDTERFRTTTPVVAIDTTDTGLLVETESGARYELLGPRAESPALLQLAAMHYARPMNNLMQ